MKTKTATAQTETIENLRARVVVMTTRCRRAQQRARKAEFALALVARAVRHVLPLEVA